mgnify:CR=1 FL=1
MSFPRLRLFPLLVFLALALMGSVGAQAPPCQGPGEFVTPHDRIPNFAHCPTVASITNGPWSDPTTWDTGTLPSDTDVVLVRHAVHYDVPAARVHTIGIAAGASLSHAVDMSTGLHVGILLVHPGGTYTIGTLEQPLSLPHTATVVIRDIPLCTDNTGTCLFDPFQFGTGLLAMDGATVQMHGAALTPTWVQLGAPILAGSPTLQLATPVSGWRVGDRLVVPDTRHVLLATDYAGKPLTVGHNEWEELTIARLDGGILTPTLAQPVQYAHDARAHVQNLSRTIVIRSENPEGTRGHIFLTRRALVEVRFARFADLGRTTVHALHSTTCDQYTLACIIGTNQVGRYMLHLHHVLGLAGLPATQPQWVIEGNAFQGAAKWAVTIHDSHYGRLAGNTCYDAKAGCYATEDGSESLNVIEGNMAVRCDGNGHGPTGDNPPGSEGSCFWFRQPYSWINGNVAANAGWANMMLFTQGLVENGTSVPVRYPKWKGADTVVDGEYTTSKTMNTGRFAMNPLSFHGNTVYGSRRSGLEVWRGGRPDAPLMVTAFTAWHNRGGQLVAGYASNIALYTSDLRCDARNMAAATFESKKAEHQGFLGEFASGSTYVIEQTTIDGCARGIWLPVINRRDTGQEVVLSTLILRNKLNIAIRPDPKRTAPVKVRTCNLTHVPMPGQVHTQMGSGAIVTECVIPSTTPP